MCLVEVEKMPKLMTACTLPVAEGMVVRTETPQVAAARKYMLEFLLTNHPLDCPVCDKGGECELQDMAFRYGAGESRYTETKVHTPEKQYSPVVFFDAPRCILCYRCVRICNEGMGVNALGVVERGAVSEIAPNHGDHLECDECGACIDICPVGALTSGIYRYQTRPWEMTHVGTICTHCSDGCKTTLGTRNDQILRGNNRDRSGINGEFLCIKGRYGFDFYEHPDRLQAPLMRVNGRLEEVSWSQALAAVAEKFKQTAGAGTFGVIGSNHTTNEENYYLQKFARTGARHQQHRSSPHRRCGDVAGCAERQIGQAGHRGGSLRAQSVPGAGRRPGAGTPAALLPDPRQLAASPGARLRGDAQGRCAKTITLPPLCAGRDYESLRDKLKAEPELAILFDDSYQGGELRKLVEFGESLGIPVRYVCLVDYANSRGAIDMGLTPELLPGYRASGQAGLHLDEMLAAELSVLWVVGANPLEHAARKARFPGGAGFVPDRNRAPGRRRVAGRLRLRKERHGDQRHRRSAAPEARHQDHGRQAGSRNHRLHRARNGSGGRAGAVDSGRRFRRDPQECSRLRCRRAGAARQAARRKPCR